MTDKVYRIKLYRKNTGGFEGLVIATSRLKAIKQAERRAALLAPKPLPIFSTAKPLLNGKPLKPKLRGENKTVRCEVVCLGRAK